jgi:putative transposase
VPLLSPDERNLCLQSLEEMRHKHNFSLHAYVVMPDHVHFLAGFFSAELPDFMHDWKIRSAHEIARHRKSCGRIWQARYFDFIPRRVSDFWQKLDYIHRNPAEAGLVRDATEWGWSSAAFYSEKREPPIPVDMPYLPLDSNAPLWPMHGKARI